MRNDVKVSWSVCPHKSAAVCGCAGYGAGRRIATRTAAVLDHHRLIETLVQPFAEVRHNSATGREAA